MEMNKRDLQRLREIEQMSSSSDEEVTLLRKQLVQASSPRPPRRGLPRDVGCQQAEPVTLALQGEPVVEQYLAREHVVPVGCDVAVLAHRRSRST